MITGLVADATSLPNNLNYWRLSVCTLRGTAGITAKIILFSIKYPFLRITNLGEKVWFKKVWEQLCNLLTSKKNCKIWLEFNQGGFGEKEKYQLLAGWFSFFARLQCEWQKKKHQTIQLWNRNSNVSIEWSNSCVFI